MYNHQVTSGQWLGAAVVFTGISVEAVVKRKGGFYIHYYCYRLPSFLPSFLRIPSPSILCGLCSSPCYPVHRSRLMRRRSAIISFLHVLYHRHYPRSPTLTDIYRNNRRTHQTGSAGEGKGEAEGAMMRCSCRTSCGHSDVVWSLRRCVVVCMDVMKRCYMRC